MPSDLQPVRCQPYLFRKSYLPEIHHAFPVDPVMPAAFFAYFCGSRDVGRPTQPDASASFADVEADLWLTGHVLALFNVMDAQGLANGQASLIENLQLTDAAGTSLRVQDEGAGDFKLSAGGRVHVRYRVRLEHDQYRWPAGMQEVGYRTDEGVTLTGNALFLADGGEAMQGAINVEFKLPRGWQAQTPWMHADSDPIRFNVASRRELLGNALFLGTAQTETIEAGGVALTLVLGKRYQSSRQRFVDAVQRKHFSDVFGTTAATSAR